MKHTWKHCLLAAMTISLCCLFAIVPIRAREHFDIITHRVDMVVNEDGSIEVTETLFVEFDRDMHGIYINLPTRYRMTWDDGVTKSYTFPISDIQVLSDHEYDIESSLDGVQIRLGSEDYYANTLEMYAVRYTVHTRDLGLDGQQMLFYNIISGEWNTTIHRVEFSITMPKPFSTDDLYFDGPMGVTQTSKGCFEVQIDGNTITGTYFDSMEYREALTVLLHLPDQYFVFPQASSTLSIGWIICGVAAVVTALLFLKYGRDEAVIPVVSFTAPEGSNSAEVGYIIDGTVDTKDVISLILYWANAGYLTIDETDDTLTLTKKQDLPESAKRYEKTMFNALFRKRDQVTTKQLQEKFYRTLQTTQNQLTTYFQAKKRAVYTSVGLQYVAAAIAGLPAALGTALILHFYTYSLLASCIGAIAIWAMVLISTCLMISLSNRWYMLKPLGKIGRIVAAALLYLLPSAIMLILYVVCDTAWYNMLPFVLCSILMSFLAAAMRKRTAYGRRVFGEVLGLRDFILTAEKDRLEMLGQENPYIFYDILPYAYALDLTDVWNEHFKDLTIPPCEWYMTTYPYGNPYLMMHRLDHCMHDMSTSMMSTPQPRDGGGSVGSGGSFGGGFSGGGFGGSGGGGW